MRFGAFLLVLLTGCALMAPPRPADTTLRPGEIRSAQAAQGALTIGISTKADVRAALGEPVAIDFDSGYEVWVYRERLKDKAKASAAEFVLLFPRSGVLAKTRLIRVPTS